MKIENFNTGDRVIVTDHIGDIGRRIMGFLPGLVFVIGDIQQFRMAAEMIRNAEDAFEKVSDNRDVTIGGVIVVNRSSQKHRLHGKTLMVTNVALRSNVFIYFASDIFGNEYEVTDGEFAVVDCGITSNVNVKHPVHGEFIATAEPAPQETEVVDIEEQSIILREEIAERLRSLRASNPYMRELEELAKSVEAFVTIHDYMTLGTEEGPVSTSDVEEAYDAGFDEGFEEGYEQAMVDVARARRTIEHLEAVSN